MEEGLCIMHKCIIHSQIRYLLQSTNCRSECAYSNKFKGDQLVLPLPKFKLHKSYQEKRKKKVN